ncbi:DUF916 and DUF3324 domain-containing protein [Enterococcus hulanensis]|uniref:DUF916 and DUF3324 domain-containing protein n=1 Tax=Enterococcus hulanensis TaxID=2559929 RepID=A0ABU3EUK3_9ENTE|nr:DUF916 and DUF3324 domain-containing protein [Enterococcus hulanensis]MDT2598545.1 DUF916 and DUF3324 domain-containing protein [Enterococcus hulanensis]MDT2607950.1 DUF916 and DUF3324 domain-containing protein [Enterococcus hulanensis]MDT2615245.1 DUF916 and DUF3324 domain-containing protein [Enterococcus hulanensis]MDT2626784.1 DUF916 and DUF3324 domain-containing protein [Enterococcus hulanensis]MDT2654317.1 DUF916 and DUF3324 domain-containing protein [Enterococcus hulanensis]
MKFRKMAILAATVFSSLMMATPSFASEFNFAVTPKPSENQIDKQKTYFDLLLAPNQEETLTVDLRNDTDKEVVVEAQINSATTNGNGVVEYSKNAIKADKTLKYDIKNYVEAPEEITLKPQSAAEYKVKIHMPNEKFAGVIAGGITFKEKTTDKTSASSDKNDKGLAIKNEYSYVVALLMRQTTDNGAPDLKLQNVSPNQRNARNVIQGNLQNPNATYLNQLATKTTITKKGSTEALYTDEQSDMQMAPNPNFNLSVPLKGDRLKAGKYTMKIEAYGQQDPAGSYQFQAKGSSKEENYQYHWSLEKDFEIKAEVAKKLNDSDVTIKKDYTWLYILIGVLLLIVIILFIVWRKKKNDKKDPV